MESHKPQSANDQDITPACMSCAGCLSLLFAPLFLIAGMWYVPLIGLLLLLTFSQKPQPQQEQQPKSERLAPNDDAERRWEEQSPRYDWWGSRGPHGS